MSSCRCSVLVLVFLLRLIGHTCANANSQQDSWKYYVERQTTVEDRLAEESYTEVVRALVYFGSEAKDAGGQVKRTPQVVYVDASGNRLSDEQAPGVHPFNPFLVEKLSMTNTLPQNYGQSQTKPLPVSALSEIIEIFPMKPNVQLKSGAKWNSSLYLSFNGPQLWFTPKIENSVTSYDKFKARDCAVIDYTVEGQFSSDEHPERFDQNELKELRGQYHIKGHGRAYYDSADGIIVEKEQAISWTRFAERLSRLEDGSVGWKPTINDEKTVTIKVSLQSDDSSVTENDKPEQNPVVPSTLADGSSSRIVWVLIALAVVIGGLVIWRKTAAKPQK